MYLVVAEDGDGMWLDDPVAADTFADARIEAARRWPKVGVDACIVIYDCREKEVFSPSPDMSKEAPKVHDPMCAAVAVDSSDAGPCACDLGQ